MLKDNDVLLDNAALGSIEWQIKKVEDEITSKLNLVDDLEKKKKIISGFSGEVTLEIAFALVATILTIAALPVLNLYVVLNSKLLVPIIAFVLSLVVWARIRKDYYIYRDNDYNDLVSEIKKTKTLISNLHVKKMELIEMRNLIKSRISEMEKADLHCSIAPVVKYDNDQVMVKKRVLDNKRH